MVDPVLCRYDRSRIDLLVWRLPIPRKSPALLHCGRDPGLDPVREAIYQRRNHIDDNSKYGRPRLQDRLPVAGLDAAAMWKIANALVSANAVPLAEKLRHRFFDERFRDSHRNVMATTAMLIFIAGTPKQEQAAHLERFKTSGIASPWGLAEYVFSYCRYYSFRHGR